ncbi:MFS transporter [Kocuria sp. cx-455]|uniref:MFS transporter n=1 Tax=Kocuria sp. cx-455 TaxID=2771377 RepID=UPI001685BD2A|nr:MFS transporter [Kocuria sp. cx-455]MBD2764238.1 MFS transporter [Kocuria sp. cx-455]
MDIRRKIDVSRMSAYQWVIVALAALLNALDGYDVLAMAFTATSVTQEFSLSGSQLGWLLSAGLIGMAAGSLALGPFADRYGRRKILLVSLGLNGLGLLLSSTADSAIELGLWRVLTGLGVGGILATVTVITSEYSNNRHRGMAISIYTAGYGVGATLGGMGATQLIPAFGWRSVFLAGAIVTAASVILVILLLTESVDYYRARQPRGADEKLARIARRIGLEGDIEFGAPSVSITSENKSSVGQLFDTRYRVPSLLLWISFFVIMFGFYFANSWTPKLLVDSGMSEQQGILGGLMLTMGGTFGSLLYGVITTRRNERLTLIAFTVLAAVTLVLFITTTSIPTLAFISGVLVGMLINGCVAGLYTVAPQTYSPDIRTTGVGWGIGVGRIGAILAPILVGALLDSGWSPTQLYIGVAVVVVLAALALLKLRPYKANEDSISGNSPMVTTT